MSQANNHTFPVMPDHPAYAVRYCPMCGGGVDDKGHPSCDTADASQKAAEVIDYLYRLAAIHPAAASILVTKLVEPGSTLRQIAARIKIGKSAVSRASDLMADYDARLKRILHGAGRNRSLAQADRRKRERGIFYAE
jgi:hypothetical protein